MVILTNPELMLAMQNSYVLQQNLNSHQINILIEKAFELGQDAQKKLLKQFTQEKIEVEMNRLKNKEDNIKKQEQYQSQIKKIIMNAKKQAEYNAENKNKINISTIDSLLRNL